MSLKLIPWIAGAAVLAALIWIVNGWRLDANRLPLVEKELADERISTVQIKADAKVIAEASAGFQAELAALHQRRTGLPASPVRLCRPTPATSVRVPAPGTGSDGPATPAGVVPRGVGEDPGPDIGPALRALADRADEVSAQGRGLQRAADGLATN